jgi:hypothetical protein
VITVAPPRMITATNARTGERYSCTSVATLLAFIADYDLWRITVLA